MKLYLVNLMDDMHRSYSNALLTQPPLSVWVLHSLTPKDIDVHVIDEQIEDFKEDADAYALSVSTQVAKKAYDLADRLRRAGKIVILGGYHITVCPEEAAEHADCVIIGEAETSWPQICKELRAGQLRRRYIGNPTPPDLMPHIDRKAVAGKKYAMPASLYASRGCVYNCSFCGSSHILGSYRHKQISALSAEIDEIIATTGSRLLQFTDDNLLADRNWRAELLTLLQHKKVNFLCQITVDQLCDHGLIDSLAAAGCVGVAAGIETLDEENTRDINKMQNLHRDIAEAVRYAGTKGIGVAALLIVGLEHDTVERLESSMRVLRSIPFCIYDLTILRPLPGTPLYSHLVVAGETEKQWWIKDEPHASNKIVPGYLRVYFKHHAMTALELQQTACRMIAELNKTTPASAMRVVRTAMRANAAMFGIKTVAGRVFMRRNAKKWQRALGRVMDKKAD